MALDRATTRRCLLTLAHQGYADYDGKFFTLTPRVLRLGTACLATMPLPQMVQPWLDALSEELGESSSVSILDGAEIVYVARAAQRKVMSIALMPGSRLPAYCTSMGRVMLAALPEAQARDILAAELPARTSHTLTDAGAILQELARVRAQASYSLRLRRLLASVAGRSLTGTTALQLDWQRRPAPDCGAARQAEPVDPAQGVAPCDQLWLRFTNVSGQDLDVSALYFNADFSVTPLWPTRGLSNRLAPGEAARAGLRINPESGTALEEVLMLAVPVVAGAARVDLTPLAEPVQTRGIGDWFSARLSGDAEAVREFSAKPAPLRMMRQIMRVMPAK